MKRVELSNVEIGFDGEFIVKVAGRSKFEEDVDDFLATYPRGTVMFVRYGLPGEPMNGWLEVPE